MAMALLFLTTVQRIQKLQDVERLLRWIAVATLGMAAFALLQYVTSNGKYFWFYEHPFAKTQYVVLGSFTNRNHFAHFIALGLGPFLWWALDGLRTHHRRQAISEGSCGENHGWHGVDVGLRFTALAFVVFAGLMSLSRGGILAMLLAVVVCVLILSRGSLIRRRTALALAGSVILLGACLGTYGYKLVATRLHNLPSLEDVGKDLGRFALWRADARAVADYPWTGTGLGSHREVCPIYYWDGQPDRNVEYTHAENGYVQAALEGGVPGLLLVLAAVALCTYWSLRPLFGELPPRVLLCIAAVAPGLAASFFHSMVDFVWYVPGCMVVVVLLAAAACRLWQFTCDGQGRPAREFWISRGGWVLMAVCLLAIGCFLVRSQLRSVRAEPHWHRSIMLSRGFYHLDEAEQYDVLKSMAAELAAVVRFRPDHARAHGRLAGLHLNLFERQPGSKINPMDVRQVREAARASRFESAAALKEWLSRAFGPRHEHLYKAWYHARQAMTHCPLRAEAYLHLAQLSFLEGQSALGKSAYVEQALKVRPFDASVAFEAGYEALLSGDVDRACECWRVCFRVNRRYRNQLIKLLAPWTAASVFLDTFELDEKAIELLAESYRLADRPDDYRLVLRRLAQSRRQRARALQGTDAVEAWIEAAEAYEDLDDPSQRLECLQSAVRSDASHYEAHYLLGKCFYDLRQYATAAKHLRWCLQRRPYDETLRTLVEAAVNERLRLSSRRKGDKS
jgi:O-antigen ligase/thioredoxin-like negative regulator of GroEL